MCTVSYISLQNKKVITSNRDEKLTRPQSNKPNEEVINGCKVIFPKDPHAGGTWFAINENGASAVLLNGAFEKHVSKANYSKSRGLVLLDIISQPNPLQYLHMVSLQTIEAFTLVLYHHHALIEFRWDEAQKYFNELDQDGNYIWSSATLYTHEVRQTREKLFNAFIANETNMSEEHIKRFHTTSDNDFENGFVMHRPNQAQTFSVTQAVYIDKFVAFSHHNLLNHEQHDSAITIR
ncbi:MAG: NRDE family protein [Bacteroidetes bacterium]|nr:NRDE family protein [Bacteroidota bacterium]